MSISIHALREESDHRRQECRHRVRHFYPRPPRGERRPSEPCRGHLPEISIHALREESDLRRFREFSAGRISIHALREESDPGSTASSAVAVGFLSTPSARRATTFCSRSTPFTLFLSTPSARRATAVHSWFFLPPVISIHALREESDVVLSSSMIASCQFLSTPSARRATTMRSR